MQLTIDVLARKYNILFWDDEAESTKRLLFLEIKQGFKKMDWTCEVTRDVEEAKEKALKGDYDAVVLDLKQNDKPVGLEILKHLKEKQPFLPIIMFTVHSDITYIQEAITDDVSYYLTVPIDSFHDVMRAIDIAVEREKSRERLVQDRYYASIGKLAGGVAHFIKNSLWNISSRAQHLLERKDWEAADYQLLDTINRRCEDANRVVQNLLGFARREKSKDVKEEFDIMTTLDDVLELVRFECDRYNIDMIKNIEKSDMACMPGNQAELSEAFLNIAKNAIEAMPDGGQIEVNAAVIENNIIIKMQDTGVGIPDDIRKNLFMPYCTTKPNSAGFGLFDTRRIIHNHRGEISIDSMEGESTTVEIIFSLQDD